MFCTCCPQNIFCVYLCTISALLSCLPIETRCIQAWGTNLCNFALLPSLGVPKLRHIVCNALHITVYLRLPEQSADWRVDIVQCCTVANIVQCIAHISVPATAVAKRRLAVHSPFRAILHWLLVSLTATKLPGVVLLHWKRKHRQGQKDTVAPFSKCLHHSYHNPSHIPGLYDARSTKRKANPQSTRKHQPNHCKCKRANTKKRTAMHNHARRDSLPAKTPHQNSWALRCQVNESLAT